MGRPARIFLAVELLLGVTYFLLPDSLLRAVVYCSLGLGMVAAVIVGTRLWRPSKPVAWYLLAAGQLSFTVGDAINYTYQWVLEVEPFSDAEQKLEQPPFDGAELKYRFGRHIEARTDCDIFGYRL